MIDRIHEQLKESRLHTDASRGRGSVDNGKFTLWLVDAHLAFEPVDLIKHLVSYCREVLGIVTIGNQGEFSPHSLMGGFITCDGSSHRFPRPERANEMDDCWPARDTSLASLAARLTSSSRMSFGRCQWHGSP